MFAGLIASWLGRPRNRAPLRITSKDHLGLRWQRRLGSPPAPAGGGGAAGGAVFLGAHQVPQEADVADGQLEGVHLGEALLVGQGGDVRPEALEGRVDAVHAAALAQVGGLPLRLRREVHAAGGAPPPAGGEGDANRGAAVAARDAAPAHPTPKVFLKKIVVKSGSSHKRQRRKRQSVTAKREKSQTPKVLTAILTLPNLT